MVRFLLFNSEMLLGEISVLLLERSRPTLDTDGKTTPAAGWQVCNLEMLCANWILYLRSLKSCVRTPVGETFSLWSYNVFQYGYLKRKTRKNMTMSSKVEHVLTIWPSNCILFSQGSKNVYPLKKLYTNVYGRFICNNSKLEMIQMSFNRWVIKQALWFCHAMEYQSAIKTTCSCCIYNKEQLCISLLLLL